MGKRAPVLALLLAGAVGAAGAAEMDGDEAWIERYLASGQAPGVARNAGEGRMVGFDQLPRLAGQRVRVELADGRERRGIVEQADAGSALLRTQFGGGYFSYTLTRAEVRGIRVE